MNLHQRQHALIQGQNAIVQSFYSVNVTGTKGGSEITKIMTSNPEVKIQMQIMKLAIMYLPVKKTKNSSKTLAFFNNPVKGIQIQIMNLPMHYLLRIPKASEHTRFIPLYSESGEKVANPASSEDAGKKEVTSIDTSESQDSHNPMRIDNTGYEDFGHQNDAATLQK